MDVVLFLPTVSCGVIGTLALRASQGLRRPGFVALALFFYIASTIGLAQLVRTLPVGPVYAAWAGLASVALLVFDRFVFGERLSWRQVAGLATIVLGVVLIDLQVHA